MTTNKKIKDGGGGFICALSSIRDSAIFLTKEITRTMTSISSESVFNHTQNIRTNIKEFLKRKRKKQENKYHHKTSIYVFCRMTDKSIVYLMHLNK